MRILIYCLTALLYSALPATAQRIPSDSSKVYTFVERMPVYPGGGLVALTADLRREFSVSSSGTSCATPGRPVFVRLIVGPSGVIYDAMSLNKAETIRNPTAKRTLPELSAGCEAAIAAAARKLARAKPGSQNGRRVTVELTVKLFEAL
jgi:protein TonB